MVARVRWRMLGNCPEDLFVLVLDGVKVAALALDRSCGEPMDQVAL
jgi:hypothetical protein